jgi:hypothetical protein
MRGESCMIQRMRAWIARVAVAAVLFGAGATARAEEKVVREPDRTVYQKKTVIDFDDVTVEGELTKPEGSYVLNRRRTTFKSLIRLRDDFVPELQKSADNL